MDICVDFDGTCVSHEFPEIGKDIGAVPVLKRLVEQGHNLILFTMRSDSKEVTSKDYGIEDTPRDYLTEAVDWFKKRDIPLYGIQENPTQKGWTTSPKAYGQLYIDDAALGCPLTYNPEVSSRVFVDWFAVERWLEGSRVLVEELDFGDSQI